MDEDDGNDYQGSKSETVEKGEEHAEMEVGGEERGMSDGVPGPLAAVG